MRAVKTDACNLVYRGDPERGVIDLDCQRVQPGLIRSFWRPSRQELDALNEGAFIEVEVWTEPIPPIAVNIADPEVREVP